MIPLAAKKFIFLVFFYFLFFPLTREKNGLPIFGFFRLYAAISVDQSELAVKILQINTEKGWRGGERQTYYHLEGLLAKGQEVHLLCRKDAAFHQKAKSMPGLVVHPVLGPVHALWFLAYQGSKFDLIHSQTSKGHKLAVLAKLFHRRPVLYTRRVDFVQQGKLVQWIYQNTDFLIVISEAIGQILSPLRHKRMAVVPSVVMPQKLNPARALEIKNQFSPRKIIATTTALAGHKDPFTMVEAIDKLREYREDFVFLHFGTGRLQDQIEALIKQKQLQDHYKLMGFYENVEDFFPAFDIFAMSSKEEGLGSSVLDAFLYKVPVVTTDAGGLKETVTNRGLVCHVGDSFCLAQSFQQILTNAALRQQLIERSYQQVLEHYTIDQSVQKYLEIYQQVKNQFVS